MGDARGGVVWMRRVRMAHHLYVCPTGGGELHRHLAFRDALRGDAELRREYECVKISIAKRAGSDRKVYAELKEIECREFIEGVLKKAPWWLLHVAP